MRSMTGYGRVSAIMAGQTLTVQISAVNRKSLDLTYRLPDAWELLEADLNDRFRQVLVRGKVHVVIELTAANSGASYSWDNDAMDDALKRIQDYSTLRGIEFKPTAELIWEIAHSQRRPEVAPALESVKAEVLKAVEVALKDFVAMREKEGAALLKDFLSRLAHLRAQVETVAQRAPGVVANYRDQLLQRLRQAGLELDLADERVLKEIALFADRCDLSEEVTRFRSHLDQFEALVTSSGEVGRKAEFILQEMGREVHTMGSKANDLLISKAVIEMKNELERVREQTANVE